MVWKRPSSVAYPSVWSHSVGKKPLPGGRIPKFRIQDAPPEMFEEVVDHMCTTFVTSEPICMNSKLSDDTVSLTECRELWRKTCQDRLVLVALLEEEDGTTKLAGVNATGISLIEDKENIHKFEGVAMQKVLGVVDYMSGIVDLFAHYGVTEYLTAMGLSVAPEYRGQGLGLELLLARIPLCKATGIRLTSTVFTADNSQELARRAGFELLKQIEYKEYKVDGEEVFPGITVKYCKTMALKIQ